MIAIRQRAKVVVGRLVGERALPVGGVARERRLLQQALPRDGVGAVLVVGPGLAARQALPHSHVDVAGTSPHAQEVTVCSAGLGAGSLPPGRYDTVIVTAITPATLPGRLAAVVPACRAGARLLVLDRTGGHPPAGPAVPDEAVAAALASMAEIRAVIGRPGHRVWLAQVRP